MTYKLPPITGGMVLGTEDEADMGLREELASLRAEIERLRTENRRYSEAHKQLQAELDAARRALEPKP